MHKPTLIPCMSIAPGRISYYMRYDNVRRSTKKNPYSTSGKTQAEKYKEATWRVRKRLQRCLTLLYDTATEKKVFSRKLQSSFSFRVNFVTLTLFGSQKHTDKEITNTALKQFIRKWKSKEPNLLYVWRAEKQKNGNIHYHLITNSFIHHRELRDMWNICLYRMGYNSRLDANSTDVHSFRDVSSPLNYMLKYITKKETKGNEVDGKIWDCSQAIKRVKNIQIEAPDRIITAECERHNALYNTLKTYDYASIQTFTLHQLKDFPILDGFYRNALEELVQINLYTNTENLIV